MGLSNTRRSLATLISPRSLSGLRLTASMPSSLFNPSSHYLTSSYLAGYMTDPHELDPIALAEEAEFFANSENLSGEFVIRPCEESLIDGKVHVSETTPESAAYWGVYAGQKDGRLLWVSDHDTQEEAAQEMARLLALYETTSHFER